MAVDSHRAAPQTRGAAGGKHHDDSRFDLCPATPAAARRLPAARAVRRGRERCGQDDGRRHLALDDYLSWETVANPRISPDGETVVYERRFVDPVADGVRSELWVIGADGSRTGSSPRGAGPRWSPDGTRIAFTRSGEPRGSQVFVRWMDAEGAESQITRLENPPSQIRWAPDSGSLAFRAVVSPPPDPVWDIDMPRAPEGAEWTAPPRIVTRLSYRRDGSGYTPAGYRHIFVVSAAGGTPRQLTSGDFHHDGPRFTPDGGAIVFSGLREPDAEYAWRQSEVYRVDLATREIAALTNRDGPDSGAVPSPTAAPSPTPAWTTPPTPTARRAST